VTLITLPDGRTIDTDINPVLEAGYALLKDNADLANFIKDDKAALQAYLVFRDDDWITPGGEYFLMGQMCYSIMLTRIRAVEGEHYKKLWWDAIYDKEGYDPELVEQFITIMKSAGWTHTPFGTTFKP
jgi:hypothetical protein